MEKFSNLQNWFSENDKLKKKFKLSNFNSAIDFVNNVAKIANSMNHHPKILIDYNVVEIETTTHDEENTLTEKDYKLTREIDKLFD